MGKTVRIAGNTFPEEARPGAAITYTERGESRTGTVIDRAPQGLDTNPSWDLRNSPAPELSGIWLWVQPKDGGKSVRVRYYSRGRDAGRAHVDHTRMVIRSKVGPARVEQAA